MANRDNIVSIGFDYKEELDKACSNIEKELNKIGNDTNISKSLKTDIDAVKKVLISLKSETTDAFKTISKGKLDTEKFNVFRTKVNKELNRVDTEIETLNESIQTLNNVLGVSGNSVDLSNAINQFKELQNFITSNNIAVDALLKTMEKMGATAKFEKPSLNTDEYKNYVKDIQNLLREINTTKETWFQNKGIEEIKKEFEKISKEFDNLIVKRVELEDSLYDLDKTNPEFSKKQAELAKTELTLSLLSKKIDSIVGIAAEKDLQWSELLDENKLVQLSEEISDELNGIKTRAEETVTEINNIIRLNSDENSPKISNKLNPNTGQVNVQVHISTKNTTLWNELSEKIDLLQDKLREKALVIPIKLVVDAKSTQTVAGKDPLSTSDNYIKETTKKLNETGENVYIDLKNIYKKTLKQVIIEAQEEAKEAISIVKDIFDNNLISVHLQVPQEEIDKISQAVLTKDNETTIDISGQIEKSRKKLEELLKILNDVDKKATETKKKSQFAGLAEEIQKAVSGLTELKDILISIKNLENTVARFGGISSTDDIEKQWSDLKKYITLISDETGKINLNKQRKEVSQLILEYQKYIKMGGKNPLSDLTDNVQTVEKLEKQLQKVNDDSKNDQSVSVLEKETSSFVKLKESVDDVIDAIGNTKVKAINTEADAMEEASKREVTALDNILNKITDIISKLNIIRDIKISDINVNASNGKADMSSGNETPVSIPEVVAPIEAQIQAQEQLEQQVKETTSAIVEQNNTQFNGNAGEIISDEKQDLDGLAEKVREVKKAFDDKNGAITKEAELMDRAATSETGSLKKIQDKVEQVKDTVEKIPKVKSVDVSGTENHLDDDIVQESQNISESNNAISIYLNKTSEAFKDAARNAHFYCKGLDEIASITQNINKNGNISYRVTDINGKSGTFTPQGKMLDFKSTIEIYKIYKEYKKVIEEIYAIEIKRAKGKINTHDLNRENQLQKEAEKLEEQILKIEKANLGLSEEREKIEAQITDNLKTVRDIELETHNKNIQVIDDEIQKYENLYSKLEKRPIENRSENYNSNLEILQKTIIEMRKIFDSMKEFHFDNDGAMVPISSDDIEKFENLRNEAEKLNKEFKIMTSTDKGSSDLSRSKAIDKMTKYLKENTRISKEDRQAIEGLINKLRELGANADVADITNQFLQLTDRVREANKEGKSLLDVVKDKAWYGLASQLGTYFSFRDLINLGKKAVNTAIDLDTALVDLRKTTSMNSSELEEFYYNSNKIAKQMGVTTQEIIDQASSWSRLGYSSQEASTQMAQLSSKFASISPGMSTEQAQSGLVSIMKAWDISTEDVEREVLDNINVLGNKFAETNLDIIDGMQRSAAALAAVGEDWRSSFALFTGGQEIVQNAEKMGTAIRSFSLRIRGYSENSEDDALEIDEELKNIKGDLVDLTKTAQHTEGISVFKEGSTTEFKSLVQYLGEVSDIWDEMTQKQQNDFLQKAFAKTQAQAGAAIIQNFDQVRKALEEMENAAGSADKEMSVIEDSIEYKINALSQTWVGTAQRLIDRGDVGKIVDGLTSISEALGFVIDKLGLLKIAGMGIEGFLMSKGLGLTFYRSRQVPYYKVA